MDRYLIATAQISLAMAGFAGVVAAYRNQSETGWGLVERFWLRLLLYNSILPFSFSLVGIFILVVGTTGAVWRWSSAFAAICLIPYAMMIVRNLLAAGLERGVRIGILAILRRYPCPHPGSDLPVRPARTNLASASRKRRLNKHLGGRINVEYLIGAVLGIVIGLLTSALGMDRDRALYPATLIVIAAYYVLFAVMGGSNEAIVAEIAVGMLFAVMAVAGFRWTLWITAAGIVGHGIFDVFHGYAIDNAGVPGFWLGFCSSIDVVLGIYLALILSSGRVKAQPAEAR